MFKKCKANDIEVHGIKTDCVLVKRSDMYRLWQVFEKDIDDNSIGKYKLEFEKSLFGEKLVLEENQNDSEKLCKIEIQEIELKNEYDKEEVAQVNLENNRLIYLASDAGCGKSTACCQGFEKSSILFVSPFNKQCIELMKDGYKAITVHTFFGRGVDSNNNFTPYDWTGSELIVFDEILLNNMIFLNLIQKFVLENHNLVKIIGNGDVNQLEPINLMLNNIDDKNTYRMNCIKQIFPNTVILKEIKRLKLEEDIYK